MKSNQIYTGDAAEIMHDFPAGFFQAVIADPPYYNVLLEEDWDTQWQQAQEYLDWCKIWMSQCLRVLKEDGLFFCFGQLGKREHVFLHLMSQACRTFQYHDLIIWDRAVGYNERRDSFTPAYEMILVLRKSDKVKFIKEAVREPYEAETIQQYLKDKRYKDKEKRLKHLMEGKFATNIFRVPSLKGSSKEKCGHPSQKPEKLIERLILCSTDKGDGIMDPFIGSGTTAVVAEKLERKWTGIEINPMYVKMAESRLRELRGELFEDYKVI